VIRVGAPHCPIPSYSTAFASRLDRQSGANPVLFYGGAYFWGGLGSIDFSTPVATVTLLHPFLGDVTPYSIDILGSVNLTSRLLGPDRWQLDVSFPSVPGKAFMIALSLSGTHPGISIGTRRVNLAPDSFTFASVKGTLWPVLSGNLGLLDSQGKGAAVLDLKRLKGALVGQPLYFVAMALDAAAPNGLAVISDPHMILPGAKY